MVTLKEVVAETQKNNRVCPQPQKWNELYGLLSNKRRKGDGWEPSLPLILAAWWDSPAMSKICRLREHIEWAFEQGCLDVVYKFLINLKEEEWHHIGEQD
jgi:hypothetical protein